MSEPTEHDASPASAAQLDRVAQIRARRGRAPSVAATPRRGRHAARGGRILAAGLGATGMLGIVTLLGLDSATTGADAPSPAQPTTQAMTPVAAPPVQVVIHRIPAASEPAVDGARVDPAPLADAVVAPPVQLSARPMVRTVTVAGPAQPRPSGSSASATPTAPAPVPAATTSGSG